MLKPEQIRNAKFTPVSAGTYNADEVDAFLSVVSQSYQEVADQNSELIKKISILADKVESYRRDEEAIKSALLDAHKMAENVNRTAAEKATGLVADAENNARSIREEAEKQAAELSNNARAQAGEIVTNARSAVASITQRAEAEADRKIAQAKDEADGIIGEANRQRETIIGSSKKDYEFYTAELAKVREELAKFKKMVEMLCNGEITPEEAAPIIAEPAAEVVAPAVQAAVAEPVQETIPVVQESVPAGEPDVEELFEDIIQEPETEVFESEDFETEVFESEPEPVKEEDDDIDDILSLFDDDGDSEFGLAADIDDMTPEIPAADPVADELFTQEPEFVQAPQEPAVPETPAEIPAEPAAQEEDDFFKGFDVDLDDMDDLDIPGSSDDDDDMDSLFDSLFD